MSTAARLISAACAKSAFRSLFSPRGFRPVCSSTSTRAFSVKSSSFLGTTPQSSYSPDLRTRLPRLVFTPSKTQVRYCSHRRNMCLARDHVEGATAAPKREVLPTNVKPKHYDLTLEPDLEKFTYEGSVVIEYVKILSNRVDRILTNIQPRCKRRLDLHRPQHKLRTYNSRSRNQGRSWDTHEGPQDIQQQGR